MDTLPEEIADVAPEVTPTPPPASEDAMLFVKGAAAELELPLMLLFDEMLEILPVTCCTDPSTAAVACGFEGGLTHDATAGAALDCNDCSPCWLVMSTRLLLPVPLPPQDDRFPLTTDALVD